MNSFEFYFDFQPLFAKIKIVLIINNDLNPDPRLIRGYSELRNNE